MEKEFYVYEKQKRAYGRGEYEVRRKAKEVKCLNCGIEWLMRKDRKSPLFCRECSVKGERNPQFGKQAWNLGTGKFDNKAYKRNYYNQYRHELKKYLIRFFNNECARCHEKNLPICVWHFHHLDDKTKVKSISQMLTNARKKLVEELNKCIMLCSNCHYIYHRGDERLDPEGGTYRLDS